MDNDKIINETELEEVAGGKSEREKEREEREKNERSLHGCIIKDPFGNVTFTDKTGCVGQFTADEWGKLRKNWVTNIVYWNIISMPKIPIDVSCTVTVAAQSEVTSVFNEIQEQLLSCLDFRYWSDNRVRSEVLLSVLIEIQSILDIQQDTFTPMVDISIGDVAVPFLRSLQVSFIQNDTQSTQTLGALRTTIETSPFSPNRDNLLTSYISG